MFPWTYLENGARAKECDEEEEKAEQQHDQPAQKQHLAVHRGWTAARVTDCIHQELMICGGTGATGCHRAAC